MQHGTKPTIRPAKKTDTDSMERERGVKPTLPPRDGTTRTEGVDKKHRAEDRQAKKTVATDTYDVDENIRQY